MIFNWFNAAEAEEFGRSIAKFFAERVPVSALPSNDNKAVRKASEATAKVLGRVEEFRKDHKLNTFQKAKLAKTVQNDLLGRGYDHAVVVDLVNLLVRAL